MYRPSLRNHSGGLRIFSAFLLTWLLIIAPLVPVVAGLPRRSERTRHTSGSRPQGVSSRTTTTGDNGFLNAPVPAPAPAPFVPTITATKTDAIITDDGDSKADPGGTEKIEYTVTISNTGDADATGVTFSDTIDAHTTLVPGSVNTQPIADPDTYAASGNIQISLAAPGVLTNDRDPDTGNNSGLTVTKVQGVGANVGVATDTTATGRSSVKGSVTLNSNGSFTYEPPPGFEGADTFTYETSDGTKTDTATVTINISGMVWFISNNAGGLNRGTFSNPFTTIASFNTANAATGAIPDPKNGDFISLRTGTGTYSETDGINLRSQQKLIGNAVQFNTVFTAAANSSSAYTTFAGAAGSAPSIVTSGGNGIDLAADNTVRGLNVGNTSGFKVSGGAVGSPIINTINLTGTGGALNISTSGAFGSNVTFGTFESTSSVAANLNLVGVTGTLGITSPGSGLSGSAAASAAVNISGGTVGFTYGGNVTKSTTGALVSVAGGHTGSITFQTGTLSATSGTGFQFDNADGTYNFNGTNTLNGGDAGLDILNGSGGTFTFSASSTITSPTGTAFNVGTSPGNPNVTYSGSITDNTTGQRAVNIDGTTGGSININSVTAGSTAGGVGNTGININNANGNVTFTTLNLGTSGTRMTAQAITITGGTGTYGLGTVSVFTTGAAGIGATNANGTLNLTTGTVNTSTATAINIDGPAGLTTLGMTLTSVTSAGGTANGISIQDTNGSFTVNGDGANTALGGNSTGGVISGKSGADGNNTQGIGVFLNNVTNITLRRMTINGTNQNFGIRGTTASNVVVEYSTINGTNGTSTGADEGSIIFDGLTGTNTFTNLVVAGTIEDNFRVRNTSGTANDIVITGSTFTNAPNDNIQIEPSSTANVTAHITNNTFTGAGGDHLQTTTTNTATLNIVFTGNFYSNGFPASLGGGITISGGNIGSAETVNFNVSNNGTAGSPLVGNVQGGAININKGQGAGTWQGQVSNNIIGNAAIANSGSAQSSGIRVENHATSGTLTALITNNTVRQWNNGPAINTQAGDAGNATNTGVLNITVTGNTATNPGALSQHGFVANIGAGANAAPFATNVACVDVRTNTLDGNVGNGGAGVRTRHREQSTVRLPGYTGSQYDITAVAAFLQANNAGSVGPATAATSSAGPGYTNTAPAGSPCPQPTVPSAPEVSEFGAVNVVKPETNGHAASRSFETASHSNGAHGHTTSNEPSLLSRAVDALSSFAGEIHSLVEPTANGSSDQTFKNSGTLAADVSTQSSQLRNHANAGNPGRTDETGRRREVRHHPRISRVRPLLLSGETVSVTIGTLRPGDSVTITFQVTVDNPPNLTLLNPPRVRNQGTVSGTNISNVLTDDTAVGGAADPTDTEVDLFDTTTTLVSDLNPSNFGDLVTFTATVAENPAQPTVDPTGTVDFIDTNNGNAVICNDVALTGGSAQCQTSSLAAGTHDIRADYSGDGNFDPSQSNIVNQVVIACTPDPVVTSTADSGAGSLREAVGSVCNGDTITFNIAGTGPHTITLTTGELPVTKNVTIRNDSGESVTVSGNNASRVFNINSGKTVAIIGLTMSGGNALDGGAILNDGTLTVVNSTLSGNAATNDGGAISTTATAPSLTLINTTISGNSAAGSGGGVIVLGGTASIINTTITNNFADSDNGGTGDGGGIRANAGTTTLKNTIVAGNFNENGASDAADDISGTVDAASSFNLIGTGGAGGLTNGVNNNQVGVANPGLGGLANNGGTTSTHALLSTSTAVDAGSNANLPADTFDLDGDANTAEALPVDQRGTGFPRTIGTSVDVGAFELGQADLSITKTDGAATEIPGTSVTYTIVVSNSGPSAVTGATVADTFPAILTGITFTSVAAGGATGNTAAGAGNINDSLTMPSGSSVTYTVNATIQSSANGSLVNTATVTAPASVVDPTPGNNSATDTDTLSPTADLEITKTDGSATEVPGTSVTYTIVVTNNGPSDANGATVADTFPAELTGVTFTSVAAGGATGNTAAGSGNISDTLNMPAGSSVTYTVNATISATATGTLSNTATVTAPGGVTDPTPGNNSATDTDTLNATADLSITKTDGSATEVPGTSVTYTITVTNAGPSTVTGATVADTFPATLTGVTFTSVAAGGATGNTAAGSGNINDTVNMPSGSSITYTVNATVSASATGTLSNTATVTAPGGVTDPTPGNNSATDTDTLVPSADVSVTKTDSPDPVQAGSNITYTITVTNNGPSDAQSLSLSDAVPANTTLVSVTTPAGWTRTDLVPAGGTGTLTFTRPTLANGASSVFTVVVNVNAGTATGTTISNTATVSSTTADPTPGNNSATATTSVQNQPNITIQDAQVVEPTSGSINMVFTVTLSNPAPGAVSVDFTTVQEAPAMNHATAGTDYTTTTGTVNFAMGEQVKSIPVPVLADANLSEVNETFQVVLSNPVNGIITDGTATGTILVVNQAGTILISELRTSGPSGAGDDFVEIYNNSDSPHVVNGTSGGYGLFKKGATCDATPILIGVIPNGTTVPARGHYLFTGTAYSLANYGGSLAAAGDQTMTSDLQDDDNVAIFSTASVVSISSTNRLDAVGFGLNTGGNCDLLREGATLTPLPGSVLEYSYVRDECGKKGNPAIFGPCPTGGLPKDSNINNDDFVFVETTGASTPAGQRLGAPGPQNLGSARLNLSVVALLLDATKGAPTAPNRVRDFAPVTNGPLGTLSIRRRFVNNTGAPVTRLRFRIVDISALTSGGGIADLRAITSGSVSGVVVADPATCTASGAGSPPCTITVLGTTLETPPNQPIGGALNSSMSAGTITLGTPLAPGASINLQLVLGVQQTGAFKFFFNIEALP